MPITGSWSNPAERRCNPKRHYPSFAKAEIAAEKASYRTGELILAYTQKVLSQRFLWHSSRINDTSNGLSSEVGFRGKFFTEFPITP